MDRAEIKSALAANGMNVPPDVLSELATWARALGKLVQGYNDHEPVVLDVAEVKVLTEGMQRMLEELGIQ